MQKPALSKGTRDFGPVQMQKRRFLLNSIENIYQRYGFVQIETPAMEQLSTLTGKYGDEGDKLLFRILNSGDFLEGSTEEQRSGSARLLPFIAEKGLRYDLTVPFARFVVMNRNELAFPFRRYQMQPVWRADRPQKGRYREFWQCDADVIGTDSLSAECDLLGIYRDVFAELNIGVKVMINHRRVLEGIAELAGIQQAFGTFTVLIDKLDKVGWDGIATDLMNLGLGERGLEQLKLQMQERPFNAETLNELKTLLSGSESAKQGISELEQLLRFKQASENDLPVTLNLSLARGLDYYTGCIFEVVPTEMKLGSISGGGRYANLTGVFGLSGMSGVGISFGIDRIYDVMEELGRWPESNAQSTRVLLCHFGETEMLHNLKLAHQLRESGIAVEVYPEVKKLAKQLEYANKKGIPFALITGEDEMRDQLYSLKDLVHGEQWKLSWKEIASKLG